MHGLCRRTPCTLSCTEGLCEALCCFMLSVWKCGLGALLKACGRERLWGGWVTLEASPLAVFLLSVGFDCGPDACFTAWAF
jgi:hypothetical protein